MDHSRSIEKAKAAQAYAETFPHYQAYRECQKKAFSKGSATLVTAGAVVYILQEVFKKKLPYDRTAFLMLPIVVGCVAAYAMTKHETRICQQMWMAMEEKHSALTSLSERREQAERENTKT